jgi:hypothetical protein
MGAKGKQAAGHFSLFLVLQKAAGAKGFRGVYRIRAMVDVSDHSSLVDHEGGSVGKQAAPINESRQAGSCWQTTIRLSSINPEWLESGPSAEHSLRILIVTN